MPSGLRKTSGNQFEIYYEQPWGGVASDKNAADIEPNQLVTQQGVVISSGILSYFNFPGDKTRFQFAGVVADSFPYIVWEQVGELFACDQYGYIYFYQNSANPSILSAKFVVVLTPLPSPVPVVASDGPWNPGIGNPPSAVKVINGIAYITNFDRHSTYSFDGNHTFTLLSNYVGGKYLGVLDDYLIQFNTNNITDGIQPNRVNWSAPGAFGTWDPAIDRTAGFNTLAEVEDQLSGFLSYANVGVAISQKGLIELSPTGIGIQPFNFTAMWISDVGQGCLYPKTISQFGQKAFLLTDSGVYGVSTGNGFSEISQAAKKVILSSYQITDFDQFNDGAVSDIAAAVVLYPYNARYSSSFYIICGGYVGSRILNFWILDITTGSWQQISYDILNLVNQYLNKTYTTGVQLQYVGINTFDIYPSEVSGAITFSNAITLVRLYVGTPDGNVPVIITPYLFNKENIDSVVNYAGNLNLVFRAEEIKLGRKPTIRRVLIKAFGSGTLVISVNGKDFGTIILDGTTTPKTYYSSKSAYTGEDPQLSVTSSNFKGCIIRVMLAGTFADGDVD